VVVEKAPGGCAPNVMCHVMTEQQPTSVKILRALLVFRLVFSAGLVILFAIVRKTNSDESTVFSGIRDGILSSLNKKGSDPDEAFGYLIGIMIIPVILIVLTLVFTKERRFGAVLWTTIADLIFGLWRGFPVLSIATLILVLTDPTKSFLKNKGQSTAHNTGQLRRPDESSSS
jgi:hypothetical protein